MRFASRRTEALFFCWKTITAVDVEVRGGRIAVSMVSVRDLAGANNTLPPDRSYRFLIEWQRQVAPVIILQRAAGGR